MYLGHQNENKQGKRSGCVYCGEEHDEVNCGKVKNIEERKKVILRSGRCLCCLKKGHLAFVCKSKVVCKFCKQNHHSSICLRNVVDKVLPSASMPPALISTTSCAKNVESGGRAALQTAQALVVNKDHKVRARVLFDTGSHKTFVTQRVADNLSIVPVRKECLAIRTFGSGKVKESTRDVVELKLMPLNGEKSAMTINAFVVPHISEICNVHPEIVKYEHPHLTNIWFSDVCPSQDLLAVDILVGIDFFHLFQEDKVVRGKHDEPVAVKTKIGWVLSGPLNGKKFISSEHINVDFILSNQTSCHLVAETKMDQEIHKLWDLETLGIKESNEVYDDLLDNVSFTGERYSVKLPWKLGHKALPSNFALSLSRLKGQIKKLKKDPDILQTYDQTIQDQLEQGIIEKVTELEVPAKQHFLPHHAVIRTDAETTKVRVVFDASAKEKKTGTSLNDCLHVGPPLTPLLFDILVRFREHKIPIIADIEKAFLNVEIDPLDRDFLRFLWMKNLDDPDSDVDIFRFNRVVFGVNCSPFLLNAVIRYHLNKYKQQDPDFNSKLANNFYVDDLVCGGNTISEAKQLFVKSKERMREGGFNLRKWKTSNMELQKEFQKEEPLNENESEETYAKETLGGASQEGKTKVLGIQWDRAADEFVFELKNFGKQEDSSSKVTKRIILSSLANLFDPLGIVSPLTVNAKVLFQELCHKKVGWDDELPEEQRLKWEKLVNDFQTVGVISLPRCLYDNGAGCVRNCTLHGFTDASKKVYCSIVYLVFETDEGIFSNLICAKTRVAPLKELSIPRLELMSARILATLMNVVKNALSLQVEIQQCRYWLDSKTALFWINNSGNWKQFVQHRVDEILKLSDKANWGHCAGVCNPADLGSRGVLATTLKESRIWWHGPHWLSLEQSHWPTELLLETTDVGTERKKSTIVMKVSQEATLGMSNLVDISRFSSLDCLLKVTCWVLRFIANLKAKKKNEKLALGEIEASELLIAEKIWIVDVQNQMQKEEGFKQLALNLGIVKEGDVLRCKGRLGNSDLSVEAKSPIILPKDHKLTELICLECHKTVHHNGLRATLAKLRSQYWVPRGRQYVKKLLRACGKCIRAEGKSYPPAQVGGLPSFRVRETLPFANVGVDFAGPLFYKATTGDMKTCYIVLFVCCTSRALHLDLIEDLTGPTFICSLRRFSARRGTPDIINSDNAKTFKFTRKFLDKLSCDYSFLSFLQSKRIQWIFNLERSPWWGGHFERLVGSTKRCLKKVLGNAKLKFDELLTVLIEIECTLNNRPLTYIYDEVDCQPLTPSHLMYGRRLMNLAEGANGVSNGFEEDESNHTKRFLYLMKKLNHFWSRWRREYLVDLREMHKNNGIKESDIAIGDVVLIKEDNVKRGQWKMGVVNDLIKGKDGITRGAKVRIVKNGKPEILN